MTGSKIAFRAGILLLMGAAGLAGTDQDIEKAAKHLPRGAVLARVPALNWQKDNPATDAVVASGPVRAPTSHDVAFVYKVGGALFLRIVSGDEAGHLELDAPLPGAFSTRTNSLPAISLKDVTSGGRPDILVLTSDGASLGTCLSIFAVENGILRNLVNDVAIEGYDFKLDCSSRNPCKIVLYGKWTGQDNSWVQIYEWLGSEFVRTDRGTEPFLMNRVRELADTAVADWPQLIPARVTLAKQAAGLYLKYHQPDAAIALCRAVLSRLEDPERSIRRTNMMKPSMIEDVFQSDLRSGKAVLHELLGKSYEAQGQHSEAQLEYDLARSIRLEQPRSKRQLR